MTDAVDFALESDLPTAEMLGRYPHVWKGLTETPWAITESMRDVIVTIAARRLAGEKLTAVELETAIDGREAHKLPYHVSYSAGPRAASSSRGRRATGQIAVLPLYGVMAARLGLIGQMSGGSSVESFMASFNQAMNDDQVSSILIDIDSPGGSTDLVAELGQLIYDARGDKPIAAIANTDACSAAYWVLTQADESACTPSGKVGSVGVYGIHQDLSEALAKAGVKPTVIQAGRYKTELHPFGPLSKEALDYHQGVVNAHYDMFVDAVARGTGVAASKVKSDFGEGRVLMAKPALNVGMIDRVATFDQMLNRLATGQVTAGKRSTSVAVTRHLELDADDMPPDDNTPDECATCGHDVHAGPCPADGATRPESLPAGDPGDSLPAPAGENPQPTHAVDSLLHRRAVREALRPPAAPAASKEENA